VGNAGREGPTAPAREDGSYLEPGNPSTAETEYRNLSRPYTLDLPYDAAEALPGLEGWPLRTQGNVWAVLLAGGDGQPLKSYTTSVHGVSTPSQYCSLNGGDSLLRLSQQRALAVSSHERMVAVVTEAHRSWWERELIPLQRTNIVVQPCNRGTGFGVLLPLLIIAKSDPEAGVIFIPSDHYVEHEEVLAEVMRQATSPEALSSDKITMLGIAPNAPDSGFGYLSPAPDSGVGVRPILKFTEKPEEAMAAELIRTGSLWSSGIFAGHVSQLLDLFSRVVPGPMSDLKEIVEHWPESFPYYPKLASFFARHPSFDFSRHLLQKHPDRLQCLAVPPCGWTDVGTSFERAALRTPRSPDGERTSSPDLAYFAPGSFLRFAANARLPPHDEK
jgi:mannose-1-phosphate guanylyltransferase